MLGKHWAPGEPRKAERSLGRTPYQWAKSIKSPKRMRALCYSAVVCLFSDFPFLSHLHSFRVSCTYLPHLSLTSISTPPIFSPVVVAQVSSPRCSASCICTTRTPHHLHELSDSPHLGSRRSASALTEISRHVSHTTRFRRWLRAREKRLQCLDTTKNELQPRQ